jgi:catechol-2,3-dioxygenase
MAVPKPVRVGHLVIRVRDVAKSVKWYEDVIGLKVTDWRPPYLREGEVVNAQGLGDFVFMTADAMTNSHELVIAPVATDAAGPDDKAVGMAHFAWMVGSLPELEEMYAHLQEIGQPLVACRDHGLGIGIYMLDPDGNETEFYYELPESEWPTNAPLHLRGRKFPYHVSFLDQPEGMPVWGKEIGVFAS